MPLKPARPPRRRISEVILEKMGKVPPDIIATMPKDGASQHDHHIFGLPKENCEDDPTRVSGRCFRIRKRARPTRPTVG
jgi:hypothetical protein